MVNDRLGEMTPKEKRSLTGTKQQSVETRWDSLQKEMYNAAMTYVIKERKNTDCFEANLSLLLQVLQPNIIYKY